MASTGTETVSWVNALSWSAFWSDHIAMPSSPVLRMNVLDDRHVADAVVQVDAVGHGVLDAEMWIASGRRRTVEPGTDLGVLDPQVVDGRAAAERAAEAAVGDLVVANPVVSPKIAKSARCTAVLGLGVAVAEHADAGAGQDRIPRSGALDGDLVDDELAGDLERAGRDPQPLPCRGRGVDRRPGSPAQESVAPVASAPKSVTSR